MLAVSDHGRASVATLGFAFASGFVYDLLVGAWLAAPCVLYLALMSPRRFGGTLQQILRRAALAMLVATILFVAAAEIVFFDEFDGRFNFVAVDYLIYPTEVVTNIWQSYPIVWILAGLAGATTIVMWALRSRLRAFDADGSPEIRTRANVAGAYALGLVLLTTLVTPRVAHVSDDRVLNEVAASGYYTFWQALLGRDAPYEGLYATRPASDVAARVQMLLRQKESANGGSEPRLASARTRADSGRDVNVVLILEESFGAAFVGTLHPRDTIRVTPAFDSLAGEGLLLTNAYATGNRTIRAIEATTASLPPLPGVSIVRRAQSTNLFTLPEVLRANGYATEFIYGGRALFDGMGAYVRANGFERIVEQRDFAPGSFKTAWGVADEVIFARALTELDSLSATKRPFFSLILTVSNHKPYTYPAGRIPEDPGAHKRLHAVRYADWALGEFLRAARTHAFFDNTLFVVMGDHGARVYGSAEIPLPSYEVPILFYKPNAIRGGQRYDALASSLDVAPTILGLLGASGPEKFFGRDLFASDSSRGEAMMTHNNELALMRGHEIAVLGLRSATTVDVIDSAGHFRRVGKPDSTEQALVEDAIAYFQGADRLYRSGALRFDAADRPRVRPPAIVAEHPQPHRSVRRSRSVGLY